MAQTRQTWTTQQLLDWTTTFFERKAIDSPRVAAEMLLSHVLKVKRLELYMDPARPAGDLERGTFRGLVERAADHEPVDYLVGQTPFFSLMLKVSPAALIPRPSTETLVEHVLQHARRTPGFARPTVIEIGTGCGAISVALAKHLPQAHVIATDLSESALDLARQNAAMHGVDDRIEFLQGDLYQPLHGRRGHYVLSNPPYIPDDEWPQVPANVKDYEPTQALRGGADGLDVIRPLIEQAASHLAQPGQLLVEFAASRKQPVLDLACQTQGLDHAHVLTDHEALPRVLVCDHAE